MTTTYLIPIQKVVDSIIIPIQKEVGSIIVQMQSNKRTWKRKQTFLLIKFTKKTIIENNQGMAIEF